jgi:hypothetical protein
MDDRVSPALKTEHKETAKLALTDMRLAYYAHQGAARTLVEYVNTFLTD